MCARTLYSYKKNCYTHNHRFGFLALRVGITRLLRLVGTGIIAAVCWLINQLDYARELRTRPPAAA